MSFDITLNPTDVFINVFRRVAEDGYRYCDPVNYDTKESFDEAVADALSETLELLGLTEPEDETRGEFLGQFYMLLEAEEIAQWEDESEEEVA